MQWAAMEFLLKATRESRGKKKLKYIIILTCRALAIATLIFAIARPLVGGFLGWGDGRVNTIILILDRSSSMEQLSKGSATSKRASAIASVQKSLNELNAPRLILIDSASGNAQEVPSPDALEELTSTSATDSHASIPSLISTAIDYIVDNALGRTEIWVASDLQESDWAPEQGRWEAIRTGINNLPQKTNLRILSLSSPPENNTAIRVTSSRRSGDDLILNLEVNRSEASGPESLPITYSLNGNRSSEKITLNGQSYQFQKRLSLGNRAGQGHGFVVIPSDTNERDNTSYFAYGEDASTETYIITEGGESPTWLDLAAAPPGFGKNKSIQLRTEEAHKINWSNATLVIWQAPLPEAPISEELLRYIESGGAALMLPPLADSKNSFLGLQWGELSQAPRGQFDLVGKWDQADGPLRDGQEGTPIPVPKLKSIQRREILGEAARLASWEDGKSFLSRKVLGEGTAIFVSTLPDYTWSNLGDADVLLPTIQRLIALGDTRFGSIFSALVGSQKAKALAGETRKRLDSHDESLSSNAAFEAGVWSLGDRRIASNRPASEDQWQIISATQLDSLFENVPYTLFEDKGQSEALTQEIWRAFLIAMLVFMITEAILCLQAKPKQPKP